MPGAPIIETTADGTHKALSLALVRYDQFLLIKITEGGRHWKSIQLCRSEGSTVANAILDHVSAMPVGREV